MLLFGAVLFLILVWLSFCFEIVREDERGGIITLGRTGRVIESGLVFKFWPFQWLKKIPIRQQQCVYEKRAVITRVGVYTGKVSEEEKTLLNKEKVNGHLHGAADLMVKTVLYFFWPRLETDLDGQDFIKTLKNGPYSQDHEKVKGFFEEAVFDAVRVVMGKKTWRECIEEREKITAEVEILLQGDDSPFFECGIKEVHVVFEEIELPEELRKAITLPEQARLKALAREREGQGEGEFAKKKGEGVAMARKMLFDAITEENLPKEALFTLREMAQGQSNTILFPYGVYEDLAKALGGNKPEKLLAFLRPEDKDALLSLLNDALKRGEGK